MIVSIQTLLLALHALAKELKSVEGRLDRDDFEADELDGLNDDLDRLTRAIGELGALYEPQREGQEQVYPALETILAKYD